MTSSETVVTLIDEVCSNSSKSSVTDTEVVEIWRKVAGLWLERHGPAPFASLYRTRRATLQGIMVVEPRKRLRCWANWCPDWKNWRLCQGVYRHNYGEDPAAKSRELLATMTIVRTQSLTIGACLSQHGNHSPGFSLTCTSCHTPRMYDYISQQFHEAFEQ